MGRIAVQKKNVELPTGAFAVRALRILVDLSILF